MTRFLFRSAVSTLVTMFLVSITLFYFVEVGSGDVTVKILGIESTAEQRASYRAQLGLDAPAWQRYLDWLIGNDFRAEALVGHPLVTVKNEVTGESEWWADVDGTLTRWKLENGRLVALIRRPGGASQTVDADDAWRRDENGREIFWGVDTKNNAVMW
ncbi:MAG: ABC transporter permease, partial [Anaerolineae bacterium]|nr:ABC transporter permease [Anaerolineae bacterium]